MWWFSGLVRYAAAEYERHSVRPVRAAELAVTDGTRRLGERHDDTVLYVTTHAHTAEPRDTLRHSGTTIRPRIRKFMSLEPCTIQSENRLCKMTECNILIYPIFHCTYVNVHERNTHLSMALYCAVHHLAYIVQPSGAKKNLASVLFYMLCKWECYTETWRTSTLQFLYLVIPFLCASLAH